MFNFTNNQVIVYIISISLSIFAFSIAYIGENQKFNIIDFEQEKQKEDSTHNDTSLSPQMFRTLSEKIDDIIKKEKLYLNSDLRVSDIATRLNSNRTYIHQAINKERSLSFSEYINHFRIEHSKQLIIDKINKGENPTIQDIIYESGFTNMSSFYRVFKNETGYTPHSWIKQNTK
ncbi:MAG: helix-turn-helix domain-containing protein [Bacteroidales bacterium]